MAASQNPRKSQHSRKATNDVENIELGFTGRIDEASVEVQEKIEEPLLRQGFFCCPCFGRSVDTDLEAAPPVTPASVKLRAMESNAASDYNSKLRAGWKPV